MNYAIQLKDIKPAIVRASKYLARPFCFVYQECSALIVTLALNLTSNKTISVHKNLGKAKNLRFEGVIR